MINKSLENSKLYWCTCKTNGDFKSLVRQSLVKPGDLFVYKQHGNFRVNLTKPQRSFDWKSLTYTTKTTFDAIRNKQPGVSWIPNQTTTDNISTLWPQQWNPPFLENGYDDYCDGNDEILQSDSVFNTTFWEQEYSNNSHIVVINNKLDFYNLIPNETSIIVLNENKCIINRYQTGILSTIDDSIKTDFSILSIGEPPIMPLIFEHFEDFFTKV